MGQRGTDMAKEAADLILEDDRFPTIAVAVEEGRVVFDNIRKFVFYLFSCNLAEIMVLLGAGLAAVLLSALALTKRVPWEITRVGLFAAGGLAGAFFWP